MPSSGVTWNDYLAIPSFVIQHVSPSAITIISTIEKKIINAEASIAIIKICLLDDKQPNKY
jgi:hypothetical protein